MQAWFKKEIRREDGFTLVEELVTIVIVGFGITLFLAMITTGTLGVSSVDRTVAGDNLARAQLELIKDAAYSADPTAVPYPSLPPDPNYTVSVAVEYWIAPNGPFTTTLRNDGMQKITVTVNDGPDQIISLEEFKVNR